MKFDVQEKEFKGRQEIEFFFVCNVLNDSKSPKFKNFELFMKN